MPRSRTISHSQIETFSQCPRKWQLQKLLHVPQAPSESLIFGDAVHQAIEEDGLHLKDGRGALSLARLAVIFEQALAERLKHDDPDGLITTEQVIALKMRGLATLAAYVEQVQPYYRPVEVELDFRLPLDLYGGGLDGWTFTGRIDAITEREGRGMTVVDFKTASKPWLLGAEHTKEQATAYYWANSELDLGLTSNRITFVVISMNSAQSEQYLCDVAFRTTTRDREDVERYVEKVQETVGAIQTFSASGDAFPTRTSALCAWCPCIGSCATGQAHLTRTGRPIAVPVPKARARS